jgi:uncharacterized protein (DUF488 family)
MAAKSINLFTIGYQGLSIDNFTKTLQQNKINMVIDIRERPFSRIKDFSRNNLRDHLALSNIEYSHLKQLGSPQNLRDKVKIDHDYTYFFKHYEIYLDGQSETLLQLSNFLNDKIICLLCLEKDPEICHRKIVARKLTELADNTDKIQIINL